MSNLHCVYDVTDGLNTFKYTIFKKKSKFSNLEIWKWKVILVKIFQSCKQAVCHIIFSVGYHIIFQ